MDKLLLFALLIFNAAMAFADGKPPVIVSKVEGNTPFPNPKLKMTKSTCKSVNLIDKMGPVKTQVQSSCYAYAAAELMNFERPNKISPMHLGLTYKNVKRLKVEDAEMKNIAGFDKGGHVNEAVEKALAGGVCPESIVPTDGARKYDDYNTLMSHYKHYKLGHERLVEHCDQGASQWWVAEEKKDVTWKALFDIYKNDEGLYDGDMKKGQKAVIHYNDKFFIAAVKKCFPTIDLSEIHRMYYKTKNPNEFILQLARMACPANKLVKPEGKLESANYEGGTQMITEENRASLLSNVNKVLDDKRPVVLDFFAKGLIRPGADNAGDHSRHSATIAGRVWADGQCKYILKNSWGADWQPSADDKAKASAGNPGYFVISEKDLMEHAYGYSAFK